MPNCFQLISRATGEAEPFSVIDDKLCAALGVGADRTNYYMEWYGIAGFRIACGKDLPRQIQDGEEWIRENPDDTHALEFMRVLRWLHEHYTSDAWVEVGKR